MSCSFQSQLVSIMEVLAKAAVAEINKRVDDSCAILRLEMTQSQRDIDVLKKRCQTMEIELRKTRGRARRKVFYPMASERFPHPVKIVLNKERSTSLLRDGEMAAEGDSLLTSAKSADVEQSAVKESILIKVETAEEDVWITDPPVELRISEVVSGAKTGPSSSFGQQHCDEDFNTQPIQAEDSMDHYLSADTPEDPVTLLPPIETSEVLTGQLRPREGDDGGLELVVKDEKEEEPDQSAGLDVSDQFVMNEAEKHLWSSNPGTDPGDPVFSYTTEQYSQNLSIFPSHGGLSMTEDPGPSIHSIGNPQANMNIHTAAAHVKRHTRTLRDEPRQQTVHIPDGQSNDRMNSIDENSLALQPRQHQYRATETTMRVSECMTGSTLATSTSTFSGYSLSRSSFNIAKRMRSQWRSGMGERRFNCTFCGKSFMRFSQLKEHLRSHTGEKPYTCEQCGRSFTKQCNLIRHAVVHSGEKPYECTQCGKCFTQRSSLKSHQRTHEGESASVSLHTAPAFPADPHTSLMLSQARCFK